jgi:hypothetical protein
MEPGAEAVLRDAGLAHLVEAGLASITANGAPVERFASLTGVPERLRVSRQPWQPNGTDNDGTSATSAARRAATMADGGMLMLQPVVELTREGAGGETRIGETLETPTVEVRVVGEPPLTAAQIRALGGINGERVSGVIGGPTLSAPLVRGSATFHGLYVRAASLSKVLQLAFSIRGTRFVAVSEPFVVVPGGLDPANTSPAVVDTGWMDSASLTNTQILWVVVGAAAGLCFVVAYAMFRLVEARSRPTVVLAQALGPSTAKAARIARDADRQKKLAAAVDEAGPVRSKLAAAVEGAEPHPPKGDSDTESGTTRATTPVLEPGTFLQPGGVPLRAAAVDSVQRGMAVSPAAMQRRKLQRAWAVPNTEADIAQGISDADRLELDATAERIIATMETDGRIPLTLPS